MTLRRTRAKVFGCVGKSAPTKGDATGRRAVVEAIDPASARDPVSSAACSMFLPVSPSPRGAVMAVCSGDFDSEWAADSSLAWSTSGTTTLIGRLAEGSKTDSSTSNIAAVLAASALRASKARALHESTGDSRISCYRRLQADQITTHA